MQQIVDIGTFAHDPAADTARVAGQKINDNFTELYANNTGVNTGDQNSVPGNAGTADGLFTPRNIDGVPFDGTADIAVIGPATNAAAAKVVPVDGDKLPLSDSASGFSLAGLLWSDMKAALQSFFDTIYASIAASVVRGHIDGFIMSVNVSAPTTSIDIGAGQAADSLNAKYIELLISLIGKDITTAWSVGSGAGLLDEGSVQDGTYHLHTVERSDTQVVDVVGSLCPGSSAIVAISNGSPGVITWVDHGMQLNAGVVFSTTGTLPTGLTPGARYYVKTILTVDTFTVSATAGGSVINTSSAGTGIHTASCPPKLPTNYDSSRYIGSFLRVSGSNLKFTQDGDKFTLDQILTQAPAFSTSLLPFDLPVPKGVRVDAFGIISSGLDVVNTRTVLLQTFDSSDQAPFSYYSPGAIGQGVGFNGSFVLACGSYYRLRTTRNTRVWGRVDLSPTGGNPGIQTYGWFNARGKNS